MRPCSRKVVHQRRAHVGRAGTRHPVAALVAFQPLAVDALRAFVGVRAVEQDDALGEWAVGQHAQQIALGPPGLGEDDGLLRGPDFLCLGEGDVQRLEQGLALGVVLDGSRQMGEGIEVGDFPFDGLAVGVGQHLRCGVLRPFLRSFVQSLVVLIQFIFERLGGFLLVRLGPQFSFQAIGNGGQGAGDGKGGRSEELAQHQRHQGTLAGRQCLKIVPLQVFRHQMVEPVFGIFRSELLHQGQALGVGNVGRDLASQRTVADGLEAGFEHLESLLLFQVGELLAEALEVAEGMLVDEAHQAEQLQQGVLQRRRGEQQFVPAGQGLLERIGDDVRRLVDVAEAVRFVNHHQIPRHGLDVAGLALGELVGANNDLGCLEGADLALADGGVVRLGFEDAARQKELLGQLLIPLLAQVRRRDHQNAPLALRPHLRQHETRFDGLAQAHFVGQQRTFGKRRVKGKERRIDLMRIEIDLRADQRAGKLFDAVRRTAPGEFVGEVFCVVFGNHWRVRQIDRSDSMRRWWANPPGRRSLNGLNLHRGILADPQASSGSPGGNSVRRV